mmetsp:Transcript_34016/g.67078  ORF Transcript_34016/g.67078 Transcript_34016/m.67078 type:complete len:114 (+) Transcript_34016:147-488(+)
MCSLVRLFLSALNHPRNRKESAGCARGESSRKELFRDRSGRKELAMDSRGSGAGQQHAEPELSGEVRNGSVRLEQSSEEQRRARPKRSGAVKNGGARGQSLAVRCGMVVRERR